MNYITRIATKRILAKYFLYSLKINYLHWKLSASRSVFSCYATYTETVTELDGHPRKCFSNDSKCCSKLRRLRSASVHYPDLRRLLKHLYKACRSHRIIHSIDTCLASGDVIQLIKLRISENDEDQLKGTYYDTSNSKQPLRMEHSELVLYFQYANAIEEFKAAVTDLETYECISCERLLRRKSATQAKNMKGSVWNRLMSFKLLNDPLS